MARDRPATGTADSGQGAAPGVRRPQETLKRFRAEARHAGALNHPCVAQVYDYRDGPPDASPYLVMGTAQYLSPERVAKAPYGPASDLHSLGIVLYECPAGQMPFDGTARRLSAALSVIPPRPRAEPDPPAGIRPGHGTQGDPDRCAPLAGPAAGHPGGDRGRGRHARHVFRRAGRWHDPDHLHARTSGARCDDSSADGPGQGHGTPCFRWSAQPAVRQPQPDAHPESRPGTKRRP